MWRNVLVAVLLATASAGVASAVSGAAGGSQAASTDPKPAENKYGVITFTRACPNWLGEYGQVQDFIEGRAKRYGSQLRVTAVEGTQAPKLDIYEFDAARLLEPGVTAKLVASSDLLPKTTSEQIDAILASHGIVPNARGRRRFARNREEADAAPAPAAEILALPTGGGDEL